MARPTEAEAKLRVSFRSQSIDLILDDAHSAFWENAGRGRQMLVDGRGFGKQAIERDHGRDSRKESEKAIKNKAGRDGEKAIFADALVGPPQDVFPSSRRYLPRRGGVAATGPFKRPLLLRGARLACTPRTRLAPRRLPRLRAVNPDDLGAKHRGNQHGRAEQRQDDRNSGVARAERVAGQ